MKSPRVRSLVLEFPAKDKGKRHRTVTDKKDKKKKVAKNIIFFSNVPFSPMKREIQNINLILIILHSSGTSMGSSTQF